MPERQTQWINPDAVPGLLRPGMRVFVQGLTGEPLTLAAALKARPAASDGVTYTGVWVPGVNTIDYAGLASRSKSEIYFATPEVQSSLTAGKARLIPSYYSRIYAALAAGPAPDLALIQVAPPDDDGQCSLGLSPDFVPALLEHDELTIIAEVNDRMPRCVDSPAVPLDRIAYAVSADHALPELPEAPLKPPLDTIARLVAERIDDGACLQLGIGRLPAAIVATLTEKKNLTVHSGMIADGVLDLLEKGVITGPVTTGVALGSQDFYRRIAERKDVTFRSVGHTHDVRVIAGLDNFTAINSVIEVDLYGQVNAETVDGHPVSGPGGLPDFVRGAAMSTGGQAFYALASTAARETVSRIVPRIKDGLVTCPRADTDWVVTEHGAARLRGLDADARAQALIAIAAPKFRDQLRDAWRVMRKHGR